MPRTRDLGGNSLTEAQIKYVKGKMRNIMRNIMRQKAALDLENADWFITADTARIAPRQYISVDFIKEKIKNAAYHTLNDIGDDFELLVSNAQRLLAIHCRRDWQGLRCQR